MVALRSDEHVTDLGLRRQQLLPRREQQVAGPVGGTALGGQVEQVLQHLVDHGAADGVG